MQEESSLEFSERLAQAMTRAGMRASKLAENASVSKGYVSGLLSGVKQKPSVETCKKFSEVLGCSLPWLIEGQSPPPLPSQHQTFNSPGDAALVAVLERIATALEQLAKSESNRQTK